jgi:hypothetical protein
MAESAGAVRVVSNQRRAMTACPSGAGYLRPVGNPDPFLLRTTASEACRAQGCSRAHSVERRQSSSDMRHDGVLGTLARRLSWRETARAFQTSWEAVFGRRNGLCSGAWRTGNWAGSNPLSVAAKKGTKMAAKWPPARGAVRSELFPLLRSVVRNGPEPSRARRCWARRRANP